MSSENIQYYRDRAQIEAKLAVKAKNESVSKIHEKLAQRYETLVESAQETSKVALKEEKSFRATLGLHWNGMGRARTE